MILFIFLQIELLGGGNRMILFDKSGSVCAYVCRRMKIGRHFGSIKRMKARKVDTFHRYLYEDLTLLYLTV